MKNVSHTPGTRHEAHVKANSVSYPTTVEFAGFCRVLSYLRDLSNTGHVQVEVLACFLNVTLRQKRPTPIDYGLPHVLSVIGEQQVVGLAAFHWNHGESSDDVPDFVKVCQDMDRLTATLGHEVVRLNTSYATPAPNCEERR